MVGERITIRRHIGTFVLDAVVGEGHTSTLRISDNPVESGAVVADHAALEPKTVTIEGVLVDYDPGGAQAVGTGAPGVRPRDAFLNDVPLPSTLTPRTRAAQGYTRRMLTSYQSGAEASSWDTGVRELAPWLPGLPPAKGKDSSGGGSRLQALYEALLTLQKSGETVDIQTGLRLYTSMLLPMVSAHQDRDGSLIVSITAREIMVVASKRVAGVSMGSGRKSGRAGAQAADRADKGKTQPGKADQSLLGKISAVLGDE